ncbi:MAG: chromosomal replication initiator protein DnaA [Aeromonadales bacterium]|nr:chromosomal replication initiator protein DnaA [Aeromonadales bacterium]
MDLQQVWNDVIQRFVDQEQDLNKKAVIQLLGTQCSFSIANDSVCFICQNEIASVIIRDYAFPLHDEIAHILGNTSLGMQIKMAGDVNTSQAYQNKNYSNQQSFNQPQNNPQVANANTGFNNYFNSHSNQNYVASNSQPSASSVKDFSSINPNKTFENYVTDPENKLVCAIAQSIAENPGAETYNPFYIYGGSGLGKTHILWAIANRIKETKPNITVAYIRAEDFIRSFVDSMAKIKNRTFDPQQVHFQDKFTQYNVFIIDDIQSLAKAEGSRSSFFDIIANFLDKPGRQLILASDVPPGNLKNFSPRLVSRFGSGVCREIYPPSSETRLAIIKRKCYELKIEFPDSVVDYIANNIRSSVREIEGAIKTLKSHVDLTGHMISYDDAVKSLSNLVNVSSQVTTLDAIKDRVAKEFEVTVASMESAQRKKTITTARSMAMVIANELIPTLSFSDIGRSFNKDHSSVLEAVKRTKHRIEENQELAAIHQKLILSLKK